MKTIVLAVLLVSPVIFLQNIDAQKTNSFDSALANKLNADDYGMKSYVLVVLKKGTSNINDKNIPDSIFRGHMANIQRLANENKLVLAGPTGENDKGYEGIFIFNTADTNAAKQWLSTDPAVISHHLDAEIYAWYGTAALQQIPLLHQKIQKKKF
jgi:uncharacterized protein YciI